MRLGQTVSEQLPALCRTTRPKGSSGLTDVCWKFTCMEEIRQRKRENHRQHKQLGRTPRRSYWQKAMWYRNETWFDRNSKVTHTKSHQDRNEAISYLVVFTTRPYACRFMHNNRYSLSKTTCESTCSQHRAFQSPTSMFEWFGNIFFCIKPLQCFMLLQSSHGD
jgi:hypothetical protein